MTHSLGDHWIPHTLTPAQLEEYEERRAILEADGMPEFEADFAARRICQERWKKGYMGSEEK